MSTVRTAGLLADGREIFYYDSAPGRTAPPDLRTPPAPAAAPHLRWDPLMEEWVAIAAHRQARTFLPPTDECPLCPSRQASLTEVPATAYEVVVFENRYPSLSSRARDPAPPPTPHTTMGGGGACEVVCFTDQHDSSFAELPPARVRVVLDALADRTAALSAEPTTAQVFCFENRGVEIGVTLHHPHGQIYAYPFLPPRTQRMLTAARRHAELTGGANLFAEVLAAERAAGVRVVAENPHWSAFVPAAARWPYEVLLAPHRRLPDLPSLSDEERDAFGPLYLEVLRRFDALFPGAPTPYISAWHQAPTGDGRDLAYLHLQLFTVRRAPGKLKYLAGSESAMGVFINDIAPEVAAAELRATAPAANHGGVDASNQT